MISITDNKNCCGCNACVQKCTKNCIAMRVDEEGFLYPSVNQDVCISCGLCERVCPIINVKEKEQGVQAFVAYSKDDDIRAKSSSGGLFTLFANKILNENGVVFGAAFDKDFAVHHIVIESEEEMSKLQGSKYLQSMIENTYLETENYLKIGRMVLFTGTACQIAGLKQFLGKDYDFLYTIDVLCHGVPSPKVWRRYLEWQENNHGGAVKRTFFRQKDFGWKTYSLKLQFSNSSEYQQIFSKDLFMQMFLSNICLRPSCHACKFKGLARPSDITIGDCWGIEKYMPEMDDDKGTSVVLVHSQRGKELFHACKSSLLFKEAEIDRILPPTADSRKSVIAHSKRIQFFEKLNDVSFTIPELARVFQPSFFVRVKRKCKSIVHRFIKKVFRK